MRSVIQGAGHAVPSKVLTNHDLEKLVETNDEWITQRTGIKERRIVSPGETSATLSAEAAAMALARAGMRADEIELIIVATVTPDMQFPSTACLVQRALGAENAAAFDLAAACAGFIYSLCTASSMIQTGQFKNALVIGVDTLSNVLDWTDRSTCVLFGDGAGAVVLKGVENTDRGLVKTVLFSDGRGADHINIEAGGSRYPYSRPECFNSHRQKLYMAGSEVYRFAVTAMGDACCKVLNEAGLTTEDVDLFVPHQANLRIIDSAAKRLNLPPEKVFVNVQKYGNTSGGSIPIALSEAVEQGKLKQGMNVLTVGFGAGVVWGANLIKW
ncbi:MAG: ketoacyl-ACP synthase III [Armatimonadetes bacterium]|nr:ketoacyl-ACP synthase III [Armatimonadota bacterium]